jgi:secreted Zn-dependent insulinase-like peptidase
LLCSDALFTLQARGWACELNAGFAHSLRDFSIFVCNITLTTEGMRHWRTIVHLVHRYLEIMKNAQPSECAALFAESILIEDASFKFQEKQSGETIAQSASTGMLEYPPEFCHCAQTCILDKDFRFEEWQRWLQRLCDPGNNMRVHFIAAKECHEEDVGGEMQWLSERWYKTEYQTEPLLIALSPNPSAPITISFAALAALGAVDDSKNELHLPPSNPYLPANFNMLPLESACAPRPVLSAERAVSWAATEVSLKEPRASFCMHLQVPWADADVYSYITNSVMIKIIEETFSTAKYLAEEAKYEIRLTHQHSTCVTSGLRVSVLGFSDKMDTVLHDVCSAIAAPALLPELLALVVDTMQQTMEELKVDDAYSHCLRPADHVRRLPWFSEAAKEQALARMTLDRLRDAHAKFMRECFATIILCGNVSMTAASNMSQSVLKALQIPITLVAADSATPAFTQTPHLALQARLTLQLYPFFSPLCHSLTSLFPVAPSFTPRNDSLVPRRVQHQVTFSFLLPCVAYQPMRAFSVMLEYDLGVQDDRKEAVASVVDKLFGRHVFQTLRTQMQVRTSFELCCAALCALWQPCSSCRIIPQLGYIAQGWFSKHFKVERTPPSLIRHETPFAFQCRTRA